MCVTNVNHFELKELKADRYTTQSHWFQIIKMIMDWKQTWLWCGRYVDSVYTYIFIVIIFTQS